MNKATILGIIALIFLLALNSVHAETCTFNNVGSYNDSYIINVTTNLTALNGHTLKINSVSIPSSSNSLIYSGFENNTKDVSPQANTLTLVGGPTITTGKYGQAYNFNGSQYINISKGNYSNATQFTISFWLKNNALNQFQNRQNGDVGLYSEWLGGGGTRLDIKYISNTSGANYGAIYVTIYNTTAGEFQTSTGTTTYAIKDVGVWHHFAFTFNGSVGTLYKDGVRANSLTVVGPVKQTTGDNGMIARGDRWSTMMYNGSIDNFHYYNYSLTASEIVDDQYIADYCDGNCTIQYYNTKRNGNDTINYTGTTCNIQTGIDSCLIPTVTTQLTQSFTICNIGGSYTYATSGILFNATVLSSNTTLECRGVNFISNGSGTGLTKNNPADPTIYNFTINNCQWQRWYDGISIGNVVGYYQNNVRIWNNTNTHNYAGHLNGSIINNITSCYDQYSHGLYMDSEVAAGSWNIEVKNSLFCNNSGSGSKNNGANLANVMNYSFHDNIITGNGCNRSLAAFEAEAATGAKYYNNKIYGNKQGIMFDCNNDVGAFCENGGEFYNNTLYGNNICSTHYDIAFIHNASNINVHDNIWPDGTATVGVDNDFLTPTPNNIINETTNVSLTVQYNGRGNVAELLMNYSGKKEFIAQNYSITILNQQQRYPYTDYIVYQNGSDYTIKFLSSDFNTLNVSLNQPAADTMKGAILDYECAKHQKDSGISYSCNATSCYFTTTNCTLKTSRTS